MCMLWSNWTTEVCLCRNIREGRHGSVRLIALSALMMITMMANVGDMTARKNKGDSLSIQRPMGANGPTYRNYEESSNASGAPAERLMAT